MVPLRRAYQEAVHGFYGWRVLMLSWGPRGGGAGTVQLGNSLFVLPLEQGLGISRGVVSSVFALTATLTNFTSPLSGLLIDRYGARRVLLGAIITVALGFVVLSRANGLTMVLVAYLGLISLGSITLSFQATSVILNNWFEKYKATAQALMQVGAGLVALAVVPVVAYAISAWGWREGAIAAAVLVIVTGLPAVLLTRDTPEEMGYQPDGTGGRSALPAAAARQARMRGLAMGQAFRTRAFWLVMGTAVCFSAALTTVQIQFVAILVWKGTDEVTAAWMLGLWGLLSAPIVIAAGWLGDRVHRPGVAAGLLILMGMGVLMLNLGASMGAYWAATLLISGSRGFYPVMWAIVGEAFGRRAFATVRGTINGFQGLGSIGMPVAAGFLFDRTGSYTLVLWIVATIVWMGAALILLTPRKKYWRPQEIDSPAVLACEQE